MHLATEMLQAIEKELEKQVKRCLEKPRMAGLWEMMAYHMGWEGNGAGPEARGKRIRPQMVCLCSAANGTNWQKSLPAAAAVELIHNFSLIHDDIEDQSPMRRNRTTLWKIWGIPQAINTGDAMFSLAHLAIFDLIPSIQDSVVLECAELLQQTCLELTQGQFLDITYEKWDTLTLDGYWQMISGKTAALLACCCELGALIGGAPSEAISCYSQFGRNLGLAFQALDDILGIWGDENKTGKSAASDLVNGKKTLPVLYGLSQQGQFFERWSTKKIAHEEIHIATHVLEAEGAKDFTYQYASKHTQLALAALSKAKPHDAAGAVLTELANSLLKRKS